MKIRINGLKVRAYKGVDKQGRPYAFTTTGGRTEDGDPVRVIFNNKGLYEAIASEATILDTVEVEPVTTREHSFTGRDGLPVSIVEAVDPTPVGLTKSQFPTTKKWPGWEDLMESAGAPASTDAPATGSGAEDSEAEF